MKTIDQWGRCWVIVTGASQGIGAAICLKFAKLVGPNSVITGLARNKENLEKTGKDVNSINSSVSFTYKTADVKNANDEDYSKILSEIVINVENKKFDRVLLFHNAGSIGDTLFLKGINNLQRINDYFSLNLSSVFVLNSVFLDIVRDFEHKPEIHIINMSSLAAIQPFKSWGLYSTGKAAREMFFRVLAEEETQLNILSYSPGAIETDMTDLARHSSEDPEMRKMFTELKEQSKFVKMEDTIEKMVKILRNGKYKSGGRVDFFDEI